MSTCVVRNEAEPERRAKNARRFLSGVDRERIESITKAMDALAEWAKRNQVFENWEKRSQTLADSQARLANISAALEAPTRLAQEAQRRVDINADLVSASIAAPSPRPRWAFVRRSQASVLRNALKETNEQLVMLVGAVNGLVEMQTTELPVLQSALNVLQDIVAVQKRTDRKTLVIVVLTLAIVFLTAALIALAVR